MTEIYLDILDSERRKTFLKLKPLAQKGGVLAGGTAISLQIKGRRSFDFDVFFKKYIVRKAFALANRIFEIKEKTVDRPNHITFLTKQGIPITLFYYEFSPLYPLVKTISLPLFNICDLAADKAHTLGRRPIWRDYVDLFFLLKEKHVALGRLIKGAQRKFGVEFSPKLFLGQLTYWKDIKDYKIEFIGRKYSPKEIQEFLKEEVLQYTKKKL